jgi:hypothetical protein
MTIFEHFRALKGIDKGDIALIIAMVLSYTIGVLTGYLL